MWTSKLSSFADQGSILIVCAVLSRNLLLDNANPKDAHRGNPWDGIIDARHALAIHTARMVFASPAHTVFPRHQAPPLVAVHHHTDLAPSVLSAAVDQDT